MSDSNRAPSGGTAPTKQAFDDGNGRGHERLNGIQRARMIAAMIDVACEVEARNLTVTQIVNRAGVSRRTFYEIFDDTEACFLGALDDGIKRVSEQVIPAYREASTWRKQIRQALTVLLGLFDLDPQLGRLLIVESLGFGSIALERRAQALAGVITAVDLGRQETRAAVGLSPLVAEGAVGAVVSMIHGRLSQREPGELIDLVNPLMSMIVLPYLGAAAARRELTGPVTEPSSRQTHAHGNPLRELEIRLTYRTVRALASVGENPGCSNRLIGQVSGIGDQGQASKLLARLEKLGLIENAASGATRGEPNAWRLTTRGKEVHDATVAGAQSDTTTGR